MIRSIQFKITIVLTLLNLISCNVKNTENERIKKAKKLNSKSINPQVESIHNKEGIDLPASNLDFLKEFNGKYAYEVKLFDYPNLTNRLKELIGENRYEFLIKTWQVENPMEFENAIFVASACEQHNCYATNFMIIVDFQFDAITVGIREEKEVEIFTEKNQRYIRIDEWANRD